MDVLDILLYSEKHDLDNEEILSLFAYGVSPITSTTHGGKDGKSKRN